ncbi:MAG: hypothetical protein EPN69_11925 [Rhodanobacter sp.]|nr:MAG: hypothetical protein EPN71_15440 [Rhodanobacter sp.]TAL90661.1 MAG: hypothetical protein EPN69_11925 [Rhodanobacter sp.]TAM43278.1 MAG: hypothetical protein EPN58_00055 [Rhodanobacter sp.]
MKLQEPIGLDSIRIRLLTASDRIDLVRQVRAGKSFTMEHPKMDLGPVQETVPGTFSFTTPQSVNDALRSLIAVAEQATKYK